MRIPTLIYDEISDTLYASFAPGETCTGMEINENLPLRINKAMRSAIDLSIFNYSLLAQPTETGRRSLPLTGLSEVSTETRAIVFDVLSRPPVSHILTLSFYTPASVLVIQEGPTDHLHYQGTWLCPSGRGRLSSLSVRPAHGGC